MPRLLSSFGVVLSSVGIVAASAIAQTPPDYVFQSSYYADADDGTPIATATNSSWSWTDTPSGSGWSGSKELSGSVSTSSISSLTRAYLDTDPATGRVIFDTKQKIAVFVKTPGTYTVSATNDIETDIDAPQNSGSVHTASVSTFPFGRRPRIPMMARERS